MRRKNYKKPPGYRRWASMKERCNNPNCKDWPRYGGRGITVCERWNIFSNFIADVGLPPSPLAQLDRIDNDRGYEPDNVRWLVGDDAGYKQQVNSRTKMVWIEVDGVQLSWKAWARRLGVSHQALSYRAKILGSRELAIRSIADLPMNYHNKLDGYCAEAN
jgi:hypothetical protein